MFAVVNAADTRRHPGFEHFAVGPGCGPRRGSERCPHAPPVTRGPRTSARSHAPRSILLARRPKRNAGSTLISFIWSPGNPLPAGTGGSENYTVGQVRELTRRGLPAQVVTVGPGASDGRGGFPPPPPQASVIPDPAHPAAYPGTTAGVRLRGNQGTCPDRHEPVRRRALVAV